MSKREVTLKFTHAISLVTQNQAKCLTQGGYFCVAFFFFWGRWQSIDVSNGSTIKNKNKNLWLNNVELCNNGIITVGTVLRIICPMPVTTYLRGNLPILETHHPAIILHVPWSYNTIFPSENLQGESSRSFILTGAILGSRAFSCVKTKCGGSFCDRQRVNEWNTPIGSCGCYTQQNRGTNNLTLLYPLMKATHNGK